MKISNKTNTIAIAILTIGVIYLLSKKLNKKFKIGKSEIHGKGVFATKNLDINEYIGNAVTNVKEIKKGSFTFKITDNLGKWLNHQATPKNNSKIVKEGDRYVLRANSKINQGEEITVDYDLNPYFLSKSEKHYK